MSSKPVDSTIFEIGSTKCWRWFIWEFVIEIDFNCCNSCSICVSVSKNCKKDCHRKKTFGAQTLVVCVKEVKKCKWPEGHSKWPLSDFFKSWLPAKNQMLSWNGWRGR